MNGEFYDQEKVTEIIESYCYEHRITEATFAKLIGVHPAHLPRIKKGEMASTECLGKIAVLGQIEFKDLILNTPERFKIELVESGLKKNIPVCI